MSGNSRFCSLPAVELQLSQAAVSEHTGVLTYRKECRKDRSDQQLRMKLKGPTLQLQANPPVTPMQLIMHSCILGCRADCSFSPASVAADKYCGDAVCTPAINILEDMGVLKELMDNNEAHFADAGGWRVCICNMRVDSRYSSNHCASCGHTQ